VSPVSQFSKIEPDMHLDFDPTHLLALKGINFEPGHWLGLPTKAWARTVAGDDDIMAQLPDAPLTRTQVRDFCRKLGSIGSGQFMHTDEQCFLVIAAWGGMRRDHARAAWLSRRDWIDVLVDIRRTDMPRVEAFKRFYALRASQRLKGIRAAYFTKFIFFLRASADGYIMDQWTSKSINLLTAGRSNIHIDYAGTVSDRNDAVTYERYCQAIECLSGHFSERPDHTEERIFSSGGKAPLPWRAYIRNSTKLVSNYPDTISI